jgi:hypothetical protein
MSNHKIFHKIDHQWGGEDTWYTKGKRWANKQKFPISHLSLGFIEWLRERWVDGRVEIEMASVDKQADELVKQWEAEDVRTTRVEETPSGVPNLPTLTIRNEVVERGTEEPSTSMESSSIENPFPDPWDGDWNDAVWTWQRINKERSL